MGSIVENAAAAASFSTLVGAVKAAGLAETLSGPGPFTVFASSNEACAKLPKGTVEDLLKPENKDKLVAILTHYVAPGTVKAKDVVGLSDPKTVNGKDEEVTVNDGTVMIAAAHHRHRHAWSAAAHRPDSSWRRWRSLAPHPGWRRSRLPDL